MSESLHSDKSKPLGNIIQKSRSLIRIKIMNFLSSIFRKGSQKEESSDIIKVFLDEDIKTHKLIRLEDGLTAENVIQQLISYPEVSKLYLSPSLNTLYLQLWIKYPKVNGTCILKRRINPFEDIKLLQKNKPDIHEYIWFLQNAEPTKSNENMQNGGYRKGSSDYLNSSISSLPPARKATTIDEGK